MEQIIRRFLLFLVPYIRFLFESETNQTVFSKIRQDICMLKIVEMIQHFQKLPSSKFFLFRTNVSYFSTLHQKSFFSGTKPILAVAQIG